MRAATRLAITLVFAAPWATPTRVAAQEVAGLGVLVVSATLVGDDTEDLSARSGVGVRGWVTIAINDRFNFLPGVAFMPKGYS